MNLYPCLKAETQLRRTRHCCILYNPLVSTRMVQIPPLEAVILALCSGSHDVDQIADCIPPKLLRDTATMKQKVITVLAKHNAYLGWSETCRMTSERYLPEHFLYLPERKDVNGRYQAPLEAMLLLTERCNFRCRYCYRGAGETKSRELTTAQWLEVIRQLAEAGCVSVYLSGGEPMLHPGFFKIIQGAHEAGMYVNFTTNGSLLTREAVEKIKDAGIRTVLVSLDTPSPEVHHSLTDTRDTFTRVVKGICHLKEAGIQPRVNAVLTKENYRDILEHAAFLQQLEVDRVVFSVCHATHIGRTDQTLELTEAEYEEAKRLCAEWKGKLPIRIENRNALWKSPNEISGCSAWQKFMTIEASGTYCFCETLEQNPFFDLGSFPEQDIMTVWHSPRIAEILHPDESQYAEKCRSCRYFSRCRSGCFVNKESFGRKPYDRDPLCRCYEHLSGT